MKNSSLNIVCGPPWISTNSGYFLAGSKAGGNAIMLCRRTPRFDSNQNSCTGCQSIAATRSALNAEIARRVPLEASMRTDIRRADGAAPVRDDDGRRILRALDLQPGVAA
jgi:hypothetical protein